MLFILSVFFSLIALVDGYKTVDPYPDFGTVSERLESAQNDYAEEVNSVLASLEAFKKEELDKVNSTVHRSSGVNGALAALINEKESAGQRLQAAMTHASAAAEALVQIFRAENSLARRPGEDPKYFSRTPELKKIELPNFDTSQSIALRDDLSENVTKLVDQAQNIVQRIEKAFNSDYNTLKPLAEQFK
jgi:ABC-type transporter Mla subunit MlaD